MRFPVRMMIAAVAVALAVVLLGVGAVSADHVLRARAEQEVAARLQPLLATAAAPEVQLKGSPFVTQLIARRYDEIDVTARGVTSRDPDLRIDTVQLHLYGVHTAGRVTAERVDGQLTLSYPDVNLHSRLPLSFAGTDPAGRGRVQTVITADLLGRPLRIVASGVPSLDENKQSVVVTDPAANVLGLRLPEQVVAPLARRYLDPVSVGPLPLGLRLTRVRAADSGLVADLAGTDVVLSSG